MARCRLAFLMVLPAALQVAAATAEPLRFDTGKRWLDVAINQPATSPAALPLFGDVNGDGRADAVLYNHQRGEAYVAISDGARFGPPRLYSYGLPQFPEPTFEAALSDLDGNGLADIVIMNHGADNVPGAATAVVALNTGNGFSYPPEATWNASWCASYQRCLAGDLNGDGLGDLAAFTPPFGTVWATLSTGAGFGVNATWNGYFCLLREVCALGDVDGDGRSDAILFKPHAQGNEKGNVLWARSTGAGFTDVRYGHGFFCIDAETCLVGDVSGDGRSDIVLVKGLGAPTLEVLVSLSNGEAFINAVPFVWANPPYFNPSRRSFGSFALADVTGDGRSDLVEWGLLGVPTTGGGSRTTGFGIDVFPVTDRPVPVPPPPPPVQEVGYGSVAAYNCQTEQHRLYFWTSDLTTGAITQSGLTDAMYSEAGTCPDLNDAPESFSVQPGHILQVVAVDPEAIGCEGQNDPNILACVYGSLAVRGATGGATCNWIVGAQQPGCFP